MFPTWCWRWSGRGLQGILKSPSSWRIRSSEQIEAGPRLQRGCCVRCCPRSRRRDIATLEGFGGRAAQVRSLKLSSILFYFDILIRDHLGIGAKRPRELQVRWGQLNDLKHYRQLDTTLSDMSYCRLVLVGLLLSLKKRWTKLNCDSNLTWGCSRIHRQCWRWQSEPDYRWRLIPHLKSHSKFLDMTNVE